MAANEALAEFIRRSRAAFTLAMEASRDGPPLLVVAHNDADGLSSAALLLKVFDRVGRKAIPRIIGRGETPWLDPVLTELRTADTGGLIVADLGARPTPLRNDVPVVLIDHHVRVDVDPPPRTTVISGYGVEPTPSTSLICWWCAQELTAVDDLLWLAAIGLVGDLGDKAPFDELDTAKKRYGAGAIKEAVVLVNAPRRAGHGDAMPALHALLAADSPKAIANGDVEGADIMAAARREVSEALAQARKIAPVFAGQVALIRMHSPCQIHPLIAQTWRGRLKDKIVIAANTGYRPGWIHFAARSATGINLIEFLAAHAPGGADEQYGQGHEQATGGALRPEAWAEFLGRLGFEPPTAKLRPDSAVSGRSPLSDPDRRQPPQYKPA